MVILGLRPPLERLMQGLAGVSEFAVEGRSNPAYDFYLPLMSLPAALGLDVDGVATDGPYLRADPDAAAAWRARLAGLGGLKVGLAWAGDPRRHDRAAFLMDGRRSIPLERLAPLLAVPGVTFVALQKGEAGAAWRTSAIMGSLRSEEVGGAWRNGAAGGSLRNGEASGAWRNGAAGGLLRNGEAGAAWRNGAAGRSLRNGEVDGAWRNGAVAAADSPGAADSPIVDWTAELDDFADTAALIEALDLVISVDTSVAHVAGALGRPVWTLNRFDRCWRWMWDRTDTPWYPTMRLFTQSTPGVWDDVVAEVAEALRLVASK
jgi:hypothetical protein